MQRRSFFKTIFGGLAAAVAVKHIPVPKPEVLKYIPVKGAELLKSGAVYAPYIPVFRTPTIHDPETFVASRKILDRYAKNKLRKDYYSKIRL